MASDETTMKADIEYDDDNYAAFGVGLSRLSRLSIETSDGDEADAEMSDNDVKATLMTNAAAVADDDSDCFWPTSLPGPRAGVWPKDYATDPETEGGVRVPGRGRKGRGRRARARERWLDRAWEMKRSNSEQCRVLVRPRGPDSGPICMDMEEVKACRELGLELPCDWTVEIPCGISGVDTSSGGNSPTAYWRISGPGDDPRDVKARLKVWAQAVALASASSLSG